MAKIRKLTLILLGVMLLTVGCRNNSDKIIETAMANMSNIESYTLVTDTKLVTDVEGQGVVTVNSTNETKGVVKPETRISITDTTKLQAGETNETEETVNYVAKEDEGIGYYEKQGDTWYKIVVDDTEMLGSLLKQPKDMAKDFMKCVDEFKLVGETNVLDRVCYSIEGAVSEDKFVDAIEIIEGIQDLGLNEEAMNVIEASKESLGNMVIQCLVDKETGELIEQSIDLSAMMKIGLQEAFKSQGSDSTVNNVACELKVSYKDINSTKAPEVPEEVYNAQILE